MNFRSVGTRWYCRINVSFWCLVCDVCLAFVRHWVLVSVAIGVLILKLFTYLNYASVCLINLPLSGFQFGFTSIFLLCSSSLFQRREGWNKLLWVFSFLVTACAGLLSIWKKKKSKKKKRERDKCQEDSPIYAISYTLQLTYMCIMIKKIGPLILKFLSLHMLVY